MKIQLLGLNTIFLVIIIFVMAGCKKEKQQVADPATLPVVTTMQFYSYNGYIYTDGPHYYNPFILNDLGVPNSVILINGHRFSQDFKESKVLFNNISTTALRGDSTQIYVMIPDNVPPGPVTLTIQTHGKSIVHPTHFTVAAPNPQLTAVSANGGMVGSKVVIYGSDFSTTKANTKVTINGVNASVDSAALTAVYFTVPPNSGNGKLVLTTHGVALTYQNDFTTTSSSFTVIDPKTKGFGPRSLALDAAGNLYGIIDNSVYKISPSGTTTVLAQIPAGTDAIPYLDGCAVDPSGNVYVASPVVQVPSRSSTQINGPAKVYKISVTGALSVFAGKDYSGQTVDGQGTNAEFWGPKHLAFDAAGNLYVNDQTSIRKITPAGLVSTFANLPGVFAMNTDARNGDLYVLVPAGGNNMGFSAVIKKIAPDGTVSTPQIKPLPGALSGGLFPDIKPVYYNAANLAITTSGDLVVALGANIYTVKNSTITPTYLNPTAGSVVALALEAGGKIYLTVPEVADQQSYTDKFLIYKVTP